MAKICTVCGGRIAVRMIDGTEREVCTNLSHDKILRQRRAAAHEGHAGRPLGSGVSSKSCPTCHTPMVREKGGGITRRWKWVCKNPQHAANVARNKKSAGRKAAATRKKKKKNGR